LTHTAVFHCRAVLCGGSTGSLLATLIEATLVEMSPECVVTTREKAASADGGVAGVVAGWGVALPGGTGVVRACGGVGEEVFDGGVAVWR
jgi:hypothetical protein